MRFKVLCVLCCAFLFSVGPAGWATAAPAPALAKAEPARGCYFSAFIGPDPSVRVELFKHGGPLKNTLEEALERLVHKDIAVEWQYFNYDEPNEVEGYLNDWRSRSFVMEIALEPRNGLGEVHDDATLHSYAGMMAAYGRPVFLRFASEMNGSWTPYHGNPSLYREKFRLIHDVLAREAPNVVMVWCVNYVPRETIDSYYPGDHYVDWVGVDFFSVMHHNNDLQRPAWEESPTAMLDYVYRRYAARKPIAICEYGASHAETLQPGIDRSDWAAGKLTELLRALPTRYPRVKMIGFLNCSPAFNRRVPSRTTSASPTARSCAARCVARWRRTISCRAWSRCRRASQALERDALTLRQPGGT